jgi:1-phosphofructokinase family hexose kinase
MILTVTLNPMLDKTVEVEGLTRGRTHRATRVGMVVGGKGVNVARQLHLLGVPTVATGCWGGPVGKQLAELLSAEGIPHDFIEVASGTREGVTYREPDGTWTAIFEPPHAVTPAEADALVEKCVARLSGTEWLVCCGSSPCDAADGVYARIIDAARRAGKASALDSYGKAFRLGVEAMPEMVKVNADEFRQTFGGTLETDDDFRIALRRIARMGIRYAVITDGPRPCYATDGADWWKVVPPSVRPVNATGSGDSMIAGVLASLEARESFGRALVRGTAAGAANARMWEVSCASSAEIAALEGGVLVEQRGPLR